MYNIVHVKGNLNIYLSLKEVQYLWTTQLYQVEERTQKKIVLSKKQSETKSE
jgi:hypothetical protein